MAPQMDDEPVASTSSHNTTSTQDSYPQDSANSTTSPSYSGYQHLRPRIASTAPRRLLPRTTARFKVGDSSALATPASPAPESPYSGGSGVDSPPPFDVRSSFAPMPKWGAVETKSNQDTRAPSFSTSTKGVLQRSDPIRAMAIGQDDEEEGGDGASDDDDKGILHAGIQWRGKTAHAVEQEMEALGDRTVMSYAPDAVYLASRLEGLKRNLEVGGERLKRWAWEDEEDEEGKFSSDEADQEAEQQGERPASPFDVSEGPQKEDLVMPGLEQHASYSASSSLNVSEGITPSDEVFDDPMQASTGSIARSTDGQGVHNLPEVPIITVDASTGKAAALDARVEIRTLRRPDLEQVRELHCYHGDGDKVSFEKSSFSLCILLSCTLMKRRGLHVSPFSSITPFCWVRCPYKTACFLFLCFLHRT